MVHAVWTMPHGAVKRRQSGIPLYLIDCFVFEGKMKRAFQVGTNTPRGSVRGSV